MKNGYSFGEMGVLLRAKETSTYGSATRRSVSLMMRFGRAISSVLAAERDDGRGSAGLYGNEDKGGVAVDG
jgi:hypothetical protein